jgi:hypothetical protein
MAEENTPVEGTDEEVVPDYSRVGFRALQALCKDRGLPGDGNSITLIERLKAWDAQHGTDVDLSAAENLPPAAEEDDPLGLDDPEDDGAPESPVGGEEAASPSSPTGAPTAGEDVIGVGTMQPSGVYPANLPAGGSVTSAAPAVVVYSDPDAPKGLPRASGQGGRADLTVKNGLVKVGEGHGAAEVRGFRHEIPIGTREITDNDHFAYIAEAHAAAHAAGHQTKGGATVGERVGYGRDANGARTAIYQVALKRVR